MKTFPSQRESLAYSDDEIVVRGKDALGFPNAVIIPEYKTG